MVRMARTAKDRRLGMLTELSLPTPVVQLAGRHRAFRAASGCTVILGREPAKAQAAGLVVPDSARLLWHLSIAHAHRYPTWDEIADARYELIPDGVTMAMLLPSSSEYVNVNEHCFHLWEIEDPRDPAIRGL